MTGDRPNARTAAGNTSQPATGYGHSAAAPLRLRSGYRLRSDSTTGGYVAYASHPLLDLLTRLKELRPDGTPSSGAG